MSFEFTQLDTAWVWLGLLGGHSQCWEKLVVHRNILSLSYHQGLPRVTWMTDFNSQGHACTNQESNPGQILRHNISVTSVTGWTQPVLRGVHMSHRWQISKVKTMPAPTGNQTQGKRLEDIYVTTTLLALQSLTHYHNHPLTTLGRVAVSYTCSWFCELRKLIACKFTSVGIGAISFFTSAHPVLMELCTQKLPSGLVKTVRGPGPRPRGATLPPTPIKNPHHPTTNHTQKPTHQQTTLGPRTGRVLMAL